MLRPKWLPTSLLFTLTALLLLPASATAFPVGHWYVAGAAGGQAQEVSFDVVGVDEFSGTSGVLLYGAEAGVGLPLGIHIDGHWFRHTNEVGKEMLGETVDAFMDMNGHEYGASLELHMGLIPGAPVNPFLGAGGSWSRIDLAGSVEFEGQAEDLIATTDLYRAYGIVGLKLGQFVGASVRGGMSFGQDNAAQAEYSLAGQTVEVSAGYEGYFVQGGMSVGF